MEPERYGMIRLFDACISSLALLVEHDSSLFSIRKPHLPICHRLAYYLEFTLFGNPEQNEEHPFVCDLGISIGNDAKILVPDILLHDRNPEQPTRPMALVCKEDYLTEQEVQSFYEWKTKSLCNLALAIAFIPQKPYFLVYRADEGWIYYYHFDRESSHCNLIRRREMIEASNDAQQLRLAIKHRRKKSQGIDNP